MSTKSSIPAVAIVLLCTRAFGDDWEQSHGLDAANPHDGPLDRDKDSYTNVEEYLNSLAPPVY
jgi:hypothetical protein